MKHYCNRTFNNESTAKERSLIKYWGAGGGAVAGARGREGTQTRFTESNLHLSSLHSNTDTFENIADQDKPAHHEYLIGMCTIGHSCIDIWLKPLFATIDVSKFRDWRVNFRNSGLKKNTFRLQSNLNSSNNDGSFTKDDSNSFLVPTKFFRELQTTNI